MYVSTVPTPFMSQDEYDSLDEHDRAEYDRQRAELEGAAANMLAASVDAAVDAALLRAIGVPGLPSPLF